MKGNIGRLSRRAQVLSRAVRDGDFKNTSEGILIRSCALVHGRYRGYANGELVVEGHNLWSDEGLTDALAVIFGSTAKRSAYYVALYGNAVDPAANWTGANFAATAGENVSTTEGYSGANRPTWTPGTAAAKAINNNASPAAFPIRATTTVTFQGAALLSAQARGATTGVLVSAMRFASPLTLPNNLDFTLKYDLQLNDS